MKGTWVMEGWKLLGRFTNLMLTEPSIMKKRRRYMNPPMMVIMVARSRHQAARSQLKKKEAAPEWRPVGQTRSGA